MCDIVLAFFGWLIICLLLLICKADVLYNALLSYGIYAYTVIIVCVIIRNTHHRVKWYVRASPSQIRCSRCHAIVPLTRYYDEQYLKSPISLSFPRMNQIFRFVGYRVLFYETMHRPYLQLDCHDCGKKQVICPYCHESIPQEAVECKYDKPSVCPHCGRKIYTPVPIREWKDSIYVGDVID